MLKKITLSTSILLISSYSWSQMLIHFDLANEKNPQRQSVVVEDNQTTACQFDNLLFEVTAKKQDSEVSMKVKVFGVTRTEKTLVSSPEFNMRLGTPASLILEKDGQAMELTIVAVDIV